MNRPIFITGTSGFLGEEIFKFLKMFNEFEVYGTYFNREKLNMMKLDITNKKNVIKLFKKIKPNFVVHCAALPGVDYCEENKKLARKINFEGTKNITDACKLFNSKLIFISTDYIFDGEYGPYKEDSKPNPLNYYGLTKLWSENYIRENLENYIIIRTTNIYGYDTESKNFVMTSIAKLKNKISLEVAIDQYGNPTYFTDLAVAIMKLIKKDRKGIYNIAGPDDITRYDFALLIADIFGLDKKLIFPMRTEEMLQRAKRPLKAGFITEKAAKEGIRMLNTKEGLALMKRKMEEYMAKQKITILGAGLAGLTAACHLKKEYEIYEKNPFVGGLASSRDFDGFILDHGPHLFFSQNKYYIKLLNKILKNNITIRKANPGQYFNGVYIPYPYMVNLHGLPKEIIEECISGFKEAQNKKSIPKNYKEWCYFNFGKGFAKHFLLPFAEKYWTVSPETLTTEWVGDRIYVPKLKEVIEGSKKQQKKDFYYYTYFKYPMKGGCGAFVNSLKNKIKNVNLNKEIKNIDTEKKQIIFKNGEKINYHKIIFTLPLPEVAEIIKNAPENVKTAAKSLMHNSVICMLIALDKPKNFKWSWVYFHDKDIPFYRVSFPANFSPYTSPKGKSSMWVEISYSKYKKLNRKNLEKNIVGSLIKTGILSKNDNIVKTEMFDMKYAYVIYNKEREKNVKIIHNFLKQNNIFPCGRFAEWAYMWMHDVILSAKVLAEKINKNEI